MSVIKEDIKTEFEFSDAAEDAELPTFSSQMNFEFVEAKVEPDWKDYHSVSSEPALKVKGSVYKKNISKRISHLNDKDNTLQNNSSGESSQKRARPIRKCTASSPYKTVQQSEDFPCGSKIKGLAEPGFNDRARPIRKCTASSPYKTVQRSEDFPCRSKNKDLAEPGSNDECVFNNELMHKPLNRLGFKDYYYEQFDDDEDDEDYAPIVFPGSNIAEAVAIAKAIDAIEENLLDSWTEVKDFHTPCNDIPNFRKINFSVKGAPGFQWDKNVAMPQTELEWFQLFFTNDLFDEITKETNRYIKENIIGNKAQSPCSIWKQFKIISVEEMKAFIGLIINIGMIPIRELKDLWTSNQLRAFPFFGKIFARDRFFQIYWGLHIAKPLDENKIGEQITPVFKYINSQSQKYFIPYKRVAIDEISGKLKGRPHTSYNTKKLDKYSIKCYSLTDYQTGYLYYTVIYLGSQTADELGRSDLENTTLRTTTAMCETLKTQTEGQGYHIFSSYNFSSPELSEELLKLDFYHTGTIMLSRIPCREMRNKTQTMKQGDVIAYQHEDKMMVVIWKDNRLGLVKVITTKYHKGSEKIERFLSRNVVAALQTLRGRGAKSFITQQFGREKQINAQTIDNDDSSHCDDVPLGSPVPAGANGNLTQIKVNNSENIEIVNRPILISKCSKYLAPIYRTDHDCSVYSFERRSLKWWRKVFFWTIEIAITNSFALYKMHLPNISSKKLLSQKNFRDQLIWQLVGNVRSQNEVMGKVRPCKVAGQVLLGSSNRLDGQFHSIEKMDGKAGECVVCSNRKGPRGRVRTSYRCSTCYDKPHICPSDCFNLYHTKTNYKK